MRTRMILYTASALVAFAANSLLCRQALGHTAIDAASFSTIRLASGAAALLAITMASRRGPVGARGSWRSATLLFLYAIPFSFAYVSLGAGTGALILFGSVQATMFAGALRTGARPHAGQWTGLLLALAGLVYLVMPGLAAPSPRGWALMTLAGSAWGVYSLRGGGAADPLAETAGNFVRALPLAAGVSVATAANAVWSFEGAMLAVLSGALASGLGYVAWYAALSGLSVTREATVQLAVPVLAAVGGVAFLAERVTARLVVAAFLILGGVGLALTRTERRRRPPRRPEARRRETGREGGP